MQPDIGSVQRGSRLLRLVTAAAVVLVTISMAVLWAMRRGTAGSDPRLFAWLAGAILVVALVTLIAAVATRSIPGVLFAAGLLLVYGAGTANYLYSLQGYAVLTEFQSVRLAEGTMLQGFDAGPLSNLREMDVTLQLERLELAAGDGGFVPRSRIRLIRKGAQARVVDVAQGKGAADGTLRFIQGAFGFAPRIVVTRNGEAVFDRYVPFTTRRVGPGVVVFEESFEIGSEKMLVRGALDLGTLDERMKGHARLGVAVTKQGKELGRGELALGHFARLADGSYIGYAGLKRWSEIDISRRNYPQPMFAGAGLVALSALLAPFLGRRK